MIDIDSFTETIKNIPEGLIAILLHRHPDPDAMSCAAAMKMILREKFEREAEIYHFGEVSHPQNKAMKNVLHIVMKEGSELDNPAGVVVLDTEAAKTGFDLGTIDIRIDHHLSDKNGATYTDVRSVGACSSILWDYIKEFEIDLSEHKEIATALLIGIDTDTIGFTYGNTADLDYEAYRHLLPHVDRIALAKVKCFTLPKIQYEKEKIAYENLELQGPIATSFIGEVNEHNRDIIPSVADRFSRMEAVSTVIVMGVVENHLIASVRSEDTRHDVAALCTKAFGKGFSGAKEGSGGARVPLGVGFVLLEGEFKQEAIKKAVEGFRTRILEALGE